MPYKLAIIFMMAASAAAILSALVASLLAAATMSFTVNFLRFGRETTAYKAVTSVLMVIMFTWMMTVTFGGGYYGVKWAKEAEQRRMVHE